MARLLLTVFVMFVCMLLPFAASAGTPFFTMGESETETQTVLPVVIKNIPSVADTLAAQLDSQLREKLGVETGERMDVGVIVTTPVALGNLEATSPLARQISEEVSRWLVTSGYSVQEIRKGRSVLFKPQAGELVLSRRTHVLANENVEAAIIVAGTYTQTRNRVRFNMRFIHAPTNEVLAMATETLPLNAEMRMLTVGSVENRGIRPSVGIRF
ncbi:MAG: FlgO family outer membrane protein [Desulfovibrionales bacterium]|nr:FlgO family outer membrane protein [Desulfovibrionales bacterium]